MRARFGRGSLAFRVAYQGAPFFASYHAVEEPRCPRRGRPTPCGLKGVVDQLFHRNRSLFAQPVGWRTEILADTLGRVDPCRAVLTDGIVGAGTSWFEQVVRQRDEGVTAKHLAGRYLPGKLSSSWRKIKPTEVLPCVIIGYTRSNHGFRSLLVATHREGALRYVGELSAGRTREEQAELARRLPALVHPGPIMPCRKQALWLEAERYCRVYSLGWTRRGRLRGTSFAGLIER